MNEIYLNNLECLHDKIKYKISKMKLTDELKYDLVNARNGDLIIKLNLTNSRELFLHSYYDPKKEAKRFIKSYDLSKAKTILLIGLGFGYHGEELLDRLTSQQELKVVVTNPNVFMLLLEHRNLTRLLSDQRVEIIIELTPNEFIRRMNELFGELSPAKSEVIIHQQSVKSMPKEFIFLSDILEKIKADRYNNKRLASIIKRNILNNINFIDDSIGINEFEDLFNGVPTFIISAGPSLDKNIEELKKVKDKGVIICVDTALTPVVKNRIKPDFIVTTEPIDTVYSRVFKQFADIEIPLLYSLGASTKVVENYKGTKILGLPEEDILMDKLSTHINRGRVKTGGTVAMAALDFAFKMGGNPIIFVGQDFAFSNDGLTHANNTFYGKQKKDISLLRKVEGISGEEVYTSTSYYLYLRSFERFISEKNDVSYIDATEGGAKIRGTKIMTLEEVIAIYCKFNIDKKHKIINLIENYNYQDNLIDIKEVQLILDEEFEQ